MRAQLGVSTNYLTVPRSSLDGLFKLQIITLDLYLK